MIKKSQKHIFETAQQRPSAALRRKTLSAPVRSMSKVEGVWIAVPFNGYEEKNCVVKNAGTFVVALLIKFDRSFKHAHYIMTLSREQTTMGSVPIFTRAQESCTNNNDKHERFCDIFYENERFLT